MRDWELERNPFPHIFPTGLGGHYGSGKDNRWRKKWNNPRVGKSIDRGEKAEDQLQGVDTKGRIEHHRELR